MSGNVRDHEAIVRALRVGDVAGVWAFVSKVSMPPSIGKTVDLLSLYEPASAPAILGTLPVSYPHAPGCILMAVEGCGNNLEEIGRLIASLDAADTPVLARTAARVAIRDRELEVAEVISERWLNATDTDAILRAVRHPKSALGPMNDRSIEYDLLGIRDTPAQLELLGAALREKKLNPRATWNTYGFVPEGEGPFGLYLCRTSTPTQCTWCFVVANDEPTACRWMAALSNATVTQSKAARMYDVAAKHCGYSMPLPVHGHPQRRIFPPIRQAEANAALVDVDYTGMWFLRHYISNLSPELFQAQLRWSWPSLGQAKVTMPLLYQSAIDSGLFE